MAEPQHQRMTPDEFFEWQKNQDKNYELVDGIPVLPLKAMTGATHKHDRAVTNTMFALMQRLHGGPCWPTTDDIATRTGVTNVRRPDITVECGKPSPTSMEALEPRIVVEVLSPSTMNLDRLRKLEEYKRHPSIKVILLVDTAAPSVTAWRRGNNGWTLENYDGLGGLIPLPEIAAEITLAEIFEGVSFG